MRRKRRSSEGKREKRRFSFTTEECQEKKGKSGLFAAEGKKGLSKKKGKDRLLIWGGKSSGWGRMENKSFFLLALSEKVKVQSFHKRRVSPCSSGRLISTK